MNLKKMIRIALILCISILFIYVIVKYQHRFRHINVKGLRNYIISFGPMASVVFIIIYSLKPVVLVFPAVLLTVLAGNIFGPVKGFAITIVGLFVSASLAFYISRSLGKPFVEKITKGKLLKLDDNIENHGFKIMLLMRLSTLFPYDALSYASGLTKMKYKDFIIATLLGTAPEMIAYSFLGQSMRHPFSKKLFIPIILVIAIAIGGSFMYKSFSKTAKKKIV